MLGVVLLGILLRFLVLWVWRVRSGSRGGRDARRLVSVVHRHFLLESFLVVICQILVILLILGRQRPPPFAHDMSQLGELHFGVLGHNLGTRVEGEEDVGPACTLGSIGILLLLVEFAPHPAHVGFQQLSSGVETRRRHII